jgi:hypothetical protein
MPLHLGIPGQQNTRNQIITGIAGTDTDQGPLNNPPEKKSHPTNDEIAAFAALRLHHMLQLLKDYAFDHTHPVDEYGPQGLSPTSTAFPNSITVQPDYDMPERIDSVTVVTPVGATLSVLQLGQRTLTLYSGAALTTPLVQALQVRGIILNSDDPRVLTITGTLTSALYLGLTGFALTRGQFS